MYLTFFVNSAKKRNLSQNEVLYINQFLQDLTLTLNDNLMLEKFVWKFVWGRFLLNVSKNANIFVSKKKSNVFYKQGRWGFLFSANSYYAHLKFLKGFLQKRSLNNIAINIFLKLRWQKNSEKLWAYFQYDSQFQIYIFLVKKYLTNIVRYYKAAFVL